MRRSVQRNLLCVWKPFVSSSPVDHLQLSPSIKFFRKLTRIILARTEESPICNCYTAVSGVPAAHSSATDPKIVMLMLCAAFALATAVPGIKSGVFDAMSTDDAMRPIEVNDLIAGGCFDLTQHRSDPPGTR